MRDVNEMVEASFADRLRGDLPKNLRLLDELLQKKGIDLADLETSKIQRVNVWEGFYKDKAGQSHKVDMAGIWFSPAWEDGPEWPVVQPGKPVTLPKAPPKPKKRKSGWLTAVVLPDIQAGFYRDPETDELVSTHDERALAIALDIIADVQPDRVVMVGDNLDFPELGKYRLTPTFARTTQATLDWMVEFLGRVRVASPHADVDWDEGNHELRLLNYIIDNAVAAFGLKRPGDKWPVWSIPTLCRLDELRVTYHAGYPANEVWLNDRVRVIHGDKVNSRGSTATRYLEDNRVSTIYGHVHRREWAEKTRHVRDGSRTTLAASFGCLCRIDGVVPSTKGGVDIEGRPVVRHEDWQQGLGLVHYKPGDGPFSIEPIAIHDGTAYHRGAEYVGGR